MRHVNYIKMDGKIMKKAMPKCSSSLEQTIMVFSTIFFLTVSFAFAGETEKPAQPEKKMPVDQVISCDFIAEVLKIEPIEKPLPPEDQIKGYLIDIDPKWKISLNVLTGYKKGNKDTPFQPGTRSCYVADVEKVFGVPAEKVKGTYKFFFTWNVRAHGKPEFENLMARTLTPAEQDVLKADLYLELGKSPNEALTPSEQGIFKAEQDIKAGKIRILYYGKPWSADKPSIDTETGLPIEAVAGCDVTEEQSQEIDAYNKRMKKVFNSTGGWGKAENGLQLRIWTAKQKYKVGEQIEVVFVFKNTSDKSFILLNGADIDNCWFHMFEFTKEDGKKIAISGPTPIFKREERMTRNEITSKGLIAHKVLLNHWKLAGLGHPYTEIGKEARTIIVTGIYSTPEGLDIMDAKVWGGLVKSKPIRIEIVE